MDGPKRDPDVAQRFRDASAVRCPLVNDTRESERSWTRPRPVEPAKLGGEARDVGLKRVNRPGDVSCGDVQSTGVDVKTCHSTMVPCRAAPRWSWTPGWVQTGVGPSWGLNCAFVNDFVGVSLFRQKALSVLCEVLFDGIARNYGVKNGTTTVRFRAQNSTEALCFFLPRTE